MHNSLISIIIPTYNRGHLIEETLNSIIAQTYSNWECIVVDDGSTDNTLEIIECFLKKEQRFQYHQRPKELIKGANTCRNYGFSLSKGKYINWFDSDDLMHKDFLKLKIEKAISGNYDFVSCELIMFNDSNIKTRISYNYNSNIFENYYCGELSFYTPGPLWKKEFLLQNYLKFDKKSKVLNDWIFSLRALFLTNNYFLLEEELCYYRVHKKSISGNLDDFNSKLIYSEFRVRLDIYKEFFNRNLITKKIKDHHFERIILLLRSLLIAKDKKAIKILIYLLKYEFRIFQKIKLMLGFITFKLFNKGYLFFK